MPNEAHVLKEHAVVLFNVGAGCGFAGRALLLLLHPAALACSPAPGGGGGGAVGEGLLVLEVVGRVGAVGRDADGVGVAFLADIVEEVLPIRVYRAIAGGGGAGTMVGLRHR